MSSSGRRLAAAPLRQLAAAAGRHCARWLSSDAAPAELPSLKSALRAIYKRIHPDLFQDHPPAKDANTRSLKLLHEYLDEAKTGPRVPLPYHFHFFIRSASIARSAAGTAGAAAGTAGPASSAAPSEPPAAGQPAAGAAGQQAAAGGAPAAPAGLREVTVTLPPPTRGAPGEPMSPTTRKAFGSLLAALGLPPVFGAGSEAEQAAAAAEYNRFVSLREFLPAAVEAVHQHAASQASAQQRMGALRTALRLGRHLTVSFGEPAASGGVGAQLPLVQRLVAAVDSLPPNADMAGLTVMIGAANGVDALGTIWLAADGSEPGWASFLAGVDVAHCRERQRLRAAVKAQEARVAAALGVGMLYTQQEASLSPQYRQALERLAAAAAERGHAAGGRYRELPVMLQAAGHGEAEERHADGSASSSSGGSSSKGSSRPAVGGCRADTDAGLLVAPMDVGAEQLYEAVDRLGGPIMSALRRRQQREAELASLRTQVERKVMLRRLLRDPSVTDAHYRSCLERMLGSAQKLSGLLHGQAVRVAQINGLSPDRSVIDIAWNWQLA